MPYFLKKIASHLLIIAILCASCEPLHAHGGQGLLKDQEGYELFGASTKHSPSKVTDFVEIEPQNQLLALGKIVFGVAELAYKGMRFVVNNPGKTLTMGLLAQLGVANAMNAFQSPHSTDIGNHDGFFKQQKAYHYGKRAALEGEFQINPVEIGDHKWPSTLNLPNGNIFTTWNKKNVDIYGRILSSDGTALTDAFKLNQDAATSQNSAAVVDLCDETVFVAWRHFDTLGGIRGRFFSLNGTAINDEFMVNQDTTGSKKYPSGKSLPNSNMFITWRGSQTGNSSVYGRILLPNGTALMDEFLIYQGESSVTYVYDTAPLAVFPNDNIFVVWRGDQQGNDDIYGRLYFPNGTALSDKFFINQNRTGLQSHPSVETLTNGDAFVTWDGDQTGNKNSYGRIFSSNGTAIANEFIIPPNNIGDQTHPTIAPLYNGNAFVAWNGDQARSYNIYGRIFSSKGIPMTDEILINQNMTANQNSPFPNLLLNGDLFVVWKGFQTGENSIYGRILTADYLNSFIQPPLLAPSVSPVQPPISEGTQSPMVSRAPAMLEIPTSIYLGGGIAVLGAAGLCVGVTWYIVNHKKKKQKKQNEVPLADVVNQVDAPQRSSSNYQSVPPPFSGISGYNSVPDINPDAMEGGQEITYSILPPNQYDSVDSAKARMSQQNDSGYDRVLPPPIKSEEAH